MLTTHQTENSLGRIDCCPLEHFETQSGFSHGASRGSQPCAVSSGNMACYLILRKSRSQRSKHLWEKQCSEWGEEVLEQEFLLPISFYDGWKTWGEKKQMTQDPVKIPLSLPCLCHCGSCRSVLKSVLGHQSSAALVMDKD